MHDAGIRAIPIYLTSTDVMIPYPIIILMTNCLGAISISGGVTLTVDSDLNGASPQFTLTCISTGGPATTVTWTRDSVTVTEGTETVLDDPVNAQYTHTLTVISAVMVGEVYMCAVANSKPSVASASITVQGIINPCTTLVCVCMCVSVCAALCLS